MMNRTITVCFVALNLIKFTKLINQLKYLAIQKKRTKYIFDCLNYSVTKVAHKKLSIPSPFEPFPTISPVHRCHYTGTNCRQR